MRILRVATLIPAFLTLAAVAAPPAPTPPLEFFAAHRRAFTAKLPQDAVAVLRSAADTEGEVAVVHRPDSDFWYLTGFDEPDAVAVLRPFAEEGKRYVLFVRPRDPTEEQWTGFRAGVEGAKARFGADESYPMSELSKKLPELFARGKSLLYVDGREAAFRDRALKAWGTANAYGADVRPAADGGPLVHQMRLVKDETELALMRHAASLSATAHMLAMNGVKPGAWERELKARMVGHCLDGGAARMAYPPIVGSGPNSVILHYDRVDRQAARGEMIVNDTACEYGMYAADVTRSYPVSGKFSPEQRALYEIVLQAQKAGIAKVKPGTAFHEVYDATVDVVVDGLLKLGLLKGKREEIIASRSYKVLYPHGSSHWLGLNVHDVGSYEYSKPEERYARYGSAQAKLAPGMVLTVEPGIYVPDKADGIDPKWWNIGVRIEDDLLVTPAGSECLSCAAPREIADVEKALGR